MKYNIKTIEQTYSPEAPEPEIDGLVGIPIRYGEHLDYRHEAFRIARTALVLMGEKTRQIGRETLKTAFECAEILDEAFTGKQNTV